MGIKMTENFRNVNHLVLNFYPDGYSIAVKLNEFPVFTSETILETAKISYEETSLLDYIENEELPPLLVEMIDASPKLSQYRIWHNGCLIIEVRDKTKVTQPNSYFILLKPTNLSMLNDVLNLTESNLWSAQDRLQLESQIVLHNSPPLFLEPDATKQPPEQSYWPNNKSSNTHNKLKNIYSNSIGYSMNNINNNNHNNTINNNNNNNSNNTNNNNTNNNNNNNSNNNSSSSNKNSNNNNININDRSNNVYHSTAISLPPELTLQQFLATTRAKKKTYAPGYLARFHRFKKYSNSNIK